MSRHINIDYDFLNNKIITSFSIDSDLRLTINKVL